MRQAAKIVTLLLASFALALMLQWGGGVSPIQASHQNSPARTQAEVASSGSVFLPIVVAPSCPSTGGIRLQMGKVAAGSITSASEKDAHDFCGNEGDIIRLDMSTTTGDLNPEATIYRADGTQLCDESSISSSFTMECTLDTIGIHKILVGDRSRNDTGSYAIYLQRLNNPGGATAKNFGDVVTGALTSIVERDTYTFEGAIGDVIRFDMSTTTGGLNPEATIYRADGTQLCDESSISSSFTMECTLDTNGIHKILVGDRSQNDTGSYMLSLTRLN